jgi:hypothetical protein
LNSDQLRWLWTVVGASGVFANIAALVIMVWLNRDANTYDWAIRQVHRNGLELARQHARADVLDMRLLLAVTFALGLVVSSMCGAGLAAIVGNGMLALGLLIASEASAVLTMGLLVVLAFVKMGRRQVIRRTVRLNRQAR